MLRWTVIAMQFEIEQRELNLSHHKQTGLKIFRGEHFFQQRGRQWFTGFPIFIRKIVTRYQAESRSAPNTSFPGTDSAIRPRPTLHR